ncbi:MAG TPA: hypothetical protein VKQ54_02875 [Caulobacteraceae bacterium]|nr:hypothetical protein [Caulobacteraceae bacterium]
MAMFPDKPEAGLVLRYSFLWRHEAEQGREEGAKDRPVVVIVLLADGEEVLVAPITTRPPAHDQPAVEIPPRVRGHLGLDADRCWISVATLNRFVWPGPDLRAVPGKRPSTAVYGFVPQRLLDAVRNLAVVELSKRIPGLVVRLSGD